MGRADSQRRRGGAILIVVLVCLGVAAAISVIVVGQIVAERQVVQTNHRDMQALWLAEAGVERAVARLASDSEYAGETWVIPAQELATDDGAVVRIQVEAIPSQSGRRSVRVEADYPDNATYRSRQLKQIVVDRDAVLARQPTEASQ